MKNFQYSHFGLAGTELYSKHWSRPRRRRVGEAEKKDTALTPESGESDRYVGHRYFAKNGMSVQPSRRLESESSCWLLILIKAAKIKKKHLKKEKEKKRP